MAAVAAAQRTWLAAHVDSDLLFLWNEAQVSLDLQHRLGQSGMLNVRKFSSIDDSRATVRAAFALDFGLDVAAVAPAGPAARMDLAALVCAWEVSKEQVSKETQMRAEAKSLRIQRPISLQEQVSMKRAVEVVTGAIPASEAPSAEYLSAKTEEVENNLPTASRLDEVTSTDDAEAVTMAASLDLSGRIQIVRRKAKTALPNNPEDFRMRMRIEMHAWMFLATKHVNRQWLQGMTVAGWNRYVDHFLGKRVYRLSIPSNTSENPIELQPPWAVVLNYEFECRKEILRAVREQNHTIDEGLLSVVTNADIKEVHFTTPIALGGSKSSVKRKGLEEDEQEGSGGRHRNGRGKHRKENGKGSGKQQSGKGSGKGKGKGKGAKGKLMANTTDGRQICFPYNSPTGCEEPCPHGRIHVCRKKGCGGAHSMADCKR